MIYLNPSNQGSSCLVKEACCGNQEAERVCDMMLLYCDLFDNAVDKDVTINMEQAGNVWINVLTVMSFNPFWLAHKTELTALLIQGMNTWLDSERCAKHEDKRVQAAADVLKSFYLEFIFHVGCLCGGFQHMRTISQKWRGFDFDITPHSPHPVYSNGDTTEAPSPPLWKQAIAPLVWEFPADHGEHRGFKTEWWYFSGNVEHLSYHVAFFRQEGKYFAHASLINHNDGRKYSYHKYPQVIGSNPEGNLRFDDWELKRHSPDRMTLTIPEIGTFEFKSETIPVLQGNHGLSKKGDRLGEASYYYSLPRLRTVLTSSVSEYNYQGSSWFDHEFSSNSMPADIVGWDWFALQMDDGMNIMVYLMRRKDGTFAQASMFTAIHIGGTTIQYNYGQFVCLPSVLKGDTYPSEWTISSGASATPLIIKVRSHDQVFKSPDAEYYEGGVIVQNAEGKQIGIGHVELTGYLNPIAF